MAAASQFLLRKSSILNLLKNPLRAALSEEQPLRDIDFATPAPSYAHT